MDKIEQLATLERELVKFLNKFKREFNFTYAEVIGILTAQVYKLNREAEEKSQTKE